MGGAAWEGHATLKAALDGLATAKGVSATRVKAVASAAFQFAKDYKRVVHDVEIFLWKAEVEHRLAGLYAMDAIMRQSQAKLGAKDPFVKRFLLHMNNTVAAVKKIPADHQENVRHVVEEWQTRGYYTPQDIEQAGGHEYSLNNPRRVSTTGASSSSSATRASPTHADPASKEKLASLLSIIKKQKELKEQQSEPLLLSQPPLLPTPSTQRSHGRGSPDRGAPPPARRSSFEDRQQGRSSESGYARDQGTPSRDRGGGNAPRGRERSRSRDRGYSASARPRDRSRDRDRDRDRSRGRDAGPGAPRHRDRRGSSPPLSPGRTRGRRDSDYSRRDSFEDSRDAKKPRSSRWGPPRPSDSGGDDNRPPVIDTRDHERSTRFESRSPRNRYDGPPGAAAPVPGQGSWPPTGYQGPPPPFRSGPPPSNSYPPAGPPSAASNGVLPQPRGGSGPSDRLTPTSRDRDSLPYGQAGPEGGSFNGGPRGPPGPGGDYPRGNDPSQGVPPRSGTPENSGDQPMGSSGEVCRKFVAGRCTFGDRCWHIHNQPAGAQQDGAPARPNTEMNQARRKTVLCANFPQGTCRYGDRCSFAHGEEDLDKSAMTARRPPPLAQDPMRGGPSPRGSSPHGSFQQQRQSPAVSPHQPYPSSAGPNAYARPPVGGPASAVGRPPYGSGLPPPHAPPQPASGGNQWAGAAAASGYSGYAVAAAPQTSQTFASASGGPAATTPAQTASSSSAAASRSRAPSRDEDEPEAAGPEFTLQYDEDD